MMTDRITLKITASIGIGGKRPGETFVADAVDGVPASAYWRQRIADKEAEIVPTSEPESGSAAPPKAKAAKQKD